MKRLVPDYYHKFACIAGDCKHSCCVGWGVYVDEKTLERYGKVSGELGKRLKRAIVKRGGAHFRLDERKRCPFLNESGLCDIITELGDGALCDICRDHPRFRNFYSSFTEMGLGLCCEEAARIILSHTEKVSFTELDGGGDNCAELTDSERELLAFKSGVIAIAQDRDKSIRDRLSELSDAGFAGGRAVTLPVWRRILLGMERLDGRWSEVLEACEGDPDFSPDGHGVETEQLLVYFIFRHVNADNDINAAVAFAAISAQFIIFASIKTGLPVCEIARMYSAEVEYSEQNLMQAIDALTFVR